LFKKKSMYSNNFIFNNLNIFKSLSFLSIYLNEYLLVKILLNKVSLKRWKKIFLFKYFSNKYLNKLNNEISNVISLNSLSIKKKEYILKEYIKFQLVGLVWLINYFSYNIIKNILKKNIFLNINKYVIRVKKLTKKTKKLIINNRFLFNNRDLTKELMDIIFIVIIYKEIKPFLDWIKHNLSILFFKKHLVFIYFINSLFNLIYNRYREDFKLFGYRLIFKGKIGKIGSIRKRKIIFIKDLISSSNVYYKADYMCNSILTVTGIISCKMYISYI
jgi:hypothetical protein